MKSEQKKLSQKIKYYHILILGCILSPLIFINSNYVNNQRAEDKLYKEKSRLFDKIISSRYLEEDKEKEKESSTSDKVNEVCNKGSDELKSYYKSGNLGDIELDEGGIECKEKDKDYMKAIISILKSKLKGEDEEGEDNDENNSNDGRRILNEEEKKEEEGEDDDLTNNLIIYGKHLLPILIFLVVAILCIPGWLMCCFCCCCNCCCCCCCKKSCCRIPCFVITYALYALVVAVCVYGLSQSNHIFVGLADTECSILRFFGELIDGESKETKPKWAGMSGIQNILDDLDLTLNNIKTNSLNELNTKIDNLDDENGPKKEFLAQLKTAHQKFFTDSNENEYISYYSKVITFPDSTNGKYVLDIIDNFGKYDEDSNAGIPANSLIWMWVEEYKLVAENADKELTNSKNDFNNILDTNFDEFNKALGEGKDTIGDIKGSIDDIYSQVTGIIADNSKTIDEYGKLGIKAVFGILALINIAIAAFMLLLCFCSGKCCTKCCCCRCICKLFTHLLWNILALLMIIIFLVGSLFTLIGKVGSDAMSIISYIVSEDNIGEGGDNVLVDRLGENKKYLTRCLIYNGSLESELNMEEVLDSLKGIDDAEKQIEDAKKKFEEKKQMVTYNYYIGHLYNITEKLKSELPFGFKLYSGDQDDSRKYLEYNFILDQINDYSQSHSKNEKWDISCNSELTCSSTFTGTACYNPWKCRPSEKSWTNEDSNIKLNAEIISGIMDAIDKANNLTIENGGYKKKLDDLSHFYEDFLNGYIGALEIANNTIKQVKNTIKEYTGEDGGIFSFINCGFVKTNLKIILKYLKESLGGDVYTIGICLILVGCSLALSISFTILLIVVINTDIDNNKKKNNIPDYALNSGGRVIQYK